MNKKLLLTICLAAASTTLSFAQGGGGGGRQFGGGATAGPATTISAITQNLKKYDGYFNFYYDEKTGKVYLEIDKFNTEFLYFSSLVDGVGNGGTERGQASSVITKFIKVGPKIFLVEPVNSSILIFNFPESAVRLLKCWTARISVGAMRHA